MGLKPVFDAAHAPGNQGFLWGIVSGRGVENGMKGRGIGFDGQPLPGAKECVSIHPKVLGRVAVRLHGDVFAQRQVLALVVPMGRRSEDPSRPEEGHRLCPIAAGTLVANLQHGGQGDRLAIPGSKDDDLGGGEQAQSLIGNAGRRNAKAEGGDPQVFQIL